MTLRKVSFNIVDVGSAPIKKRTGEKNTMKNTMTFEDAVRHAYLNQDFRLFDDMQILAHLKNEGYSYKGYKPFYSFLSKKISESDYTLTDVWTGYNLEDGELIGFGIAESYIELGKHNQYRIKVFQFANLEDWDDEEKLFKVHNLKPVGWDIA